MKIWKLLYLATCQCFLSPLSSVSLPLGKYNRGICPAAAPLCRAPRSVYSSLLFFPLANTTIPKLKEVKENMTMGTTLVTSPDGGFLVWATEFLLPTYTKCSIAIHLEALRGPGQCMFSKPLHSAVSTLCVSHQGFTSRKCSRRLWIKCRNARWSLQRAVTPTLLFFSWWW